MGEFNVQLAAVYILYLSDKYANSWALVHILHIGVGILVYTSRRYNVGIKSVFEEIRTRGQSLYDIILSHILISQCK